MPIDPDRLKSIRREFPERLPVSISILPAAWIKYRERMDEILLKHPDLFPGHYVGKQDYSAVYSETYHAGEHLDAWGCEWSNLTEGMESIVTKHPYPRREDIANLRPPTVDVGLPHGFMFLRLMDLRGWEEALYDFAEEAPELTKMIDIVRDYNIKQVRLALAKSNPATAVPGVVFGKHSPTATTAPAAAIAAQPEIMFFGDDLGTQHALPISPAMWRRYLKPAFTAIYAPVKAAGLYVYMHTDGCIWEIIPDLADCGVDIVNPQFRANGMDKLLEVVRAGRVTIDLDLDRQLFPFAAPAQIDAHIKDCVQTLARPEGGLWLKVEIAPDIPLANVDAILTAVARYREWKG